MTALTGAPANPPEGEDVGQAVEFHHQGRQVGGGNHSHRHGEDGYEEEDEQHRQLQLLKETAQELEQERFEEEEREARLQALRKLSPEEYLQQTGVSRAIEEALGLVAGLRPCNPLNLFSDIMRDKARNTHPAVRQAKLLRYVVGPSVRRGAAASAAAAAAATAVATVAAVDGGADTAHPSRAGYPPRVTDIKGDCPTAASISAAIIGGGKNKPPKDKNTALPDRRFYSQLEVLCQPLHRFLCGGKNNGFTTMGRDFDAAGASAAVDGKYGGSGGRSDGPNRTGARTIRGTTGTNKQSTGTAGRGRGGGKGGPAGSGGGGNASGDGGPRASGSGRASGGSGGGGRDGARARWHEVRRFLEALCRAAEIDAECTAAAMAVLEREGRFSPFSSLSAPPPSSSYPTPASSKKAMTPTAAPVAGGVGRGGGRWNPPEVGVDFRRFVAAVRAVLLFEGFYREARQAFLEATGRVDGSAPLDELLEGLFPPDQTNPKHARSGTGCQAREAIRERLDVGRRGETKVRLSTLTDCVLSSSFHTS